jgi:hypothetical protein
VRGNVTRLDGRGQGTGRPQMLAGPASTSVPAARPRHVVWYGERTQRAPDRTGPRAIPYSEEIR